MRRLASLLPLTLFCLLVAMGAFALDPAKHITQYAQDSWDTRDGLPQDTVQAILQTHDGYLWLGTQEGLVRFDGVRFTTFDTRNTPEMKGNFIWSLAEDRDGDLWVGTSGGLLRRHEISFTNLTKKDGLADNVVRALAVDGSGRLWIGTGGNGVQVFDHGRFVTLPPEQALAGKTIRGILATRKGEVWIRTLNKGLVRIHGGKTDVLDSRNGLSNDDTSSIIEAHDGRIWVGTHGGLDFWSENSPDRFTSAPGLAGHFVQAVHEDNRSSIWVGTDKGVLRVSGAEVESYTFSPEAGSPEVASIYEDREGDLWVGMLVGGLYRFKDGNFTTYSTQEGLGHDLARALVEDHAGNIWIATGGGLDEFDGHSFRHYTTRNGLSSDRVFALLEDADRNLWAGTGDGLDRIKDGRVTVFRVREGLANNYVRTLAQTGDGALWVGTDAGLSRYSKGKFRNYSTAEGLTNETIISLYRGRSGDLWVGTRHGVNLIHGDSVVDFPQRDAFREDIVEAFYEDENGSLWIATSTDGLKRLNQGTVTVFGPRQGLFQSTLHAIVADPGGTLWVTSNKGVFRVKRAQLDDFAAGRIGRVDAVLLGQADGMRSSECDTGSPAAMRSHDGRLWFPTVRGVAILDPRTQPPAAELPPVLVEQVGIDDAVSELAGGELSIPAGTRNVEFHYVALSYTNPDRIRFQYKLDGFDPDWVDAGGRRTAYYTNLPPGRYTFRVIAATPDGRWTPIGAALPVRARPRFYQTYWFYALAILLIAAGAWAYHRRSVAKLRSREQELRMVQQALKQKEEAERTMRESEERFSVAFRQSPDPIVLGKLEGDQVRIFDANDTMVALWGGTREELIGRTGRELGILAGGGGGPDEPSDEAEARKEFFAVLREQGMVRNLAVALRSKSGEISNFLISADLFRMGGEAWVMITGRDVTHEKAAQEALLTSEARYRDLFENANDCIFTASPEGKFLSINRAGQELCGFSASEALRKNVAEVLEGTSVEAFERNLADLLATQRASTCEVELHRRAGGTTALELALRPIVENGAVVAVQGIGRNITERRVLEKKFLQSQKMQAIGTLAGGIAHDFNNLLTVITGYSHLAKTKAGEGSPIGLDLEEIQQASHRAASLTSQLLSFSRKQISQQAPVDLNLSVQGMQRMLKRLIGEDLKIESRLDPAIPQIWADPTQIDQIIMNLATNARDAMPEGGTVRFVTSHLRLKEADPRLNLEAGDYVVLTVADTGAGMDAATLSRIFEPFFTTKDVGKGTGLGLATVYGIVQQAGGQISVASEIGRGTTFTLYFPAATRKEAEGPAPVAADAMRGSETILLVEDDPALRSLALRILESSGYTVFAASGVEEAERILQEITRPFDLIVTDVVMPDGGGMELVSRVSRKRPGVKVLFMSGYTDGKVPEQYLSGNHPSFLPKPFRPEQLAGKVRQVLDSQPSLSTVPAS